MSVAVRGGDYGSGVVLFSATTEKVTVRVSDHESRVVMI
jgi:hypothetical protein